MFPASPTLALSYPARPSTLFIRSESTNCPRFLRQSLSNPKPSQPEHTRAQREVQNGEQIGQVRRRIRHELEDVQKTDRTVRRLFRIDKVVRARTMDEVSQRQYG